MDATFATTLVQWLQERHELLVVFRYPNAGGARDYELHSSIELREELESSMGRPVILGEYPPLLEDGPDVTSGYVPDKDGRIRPGAY